MNKKGIVLLLSLIVIAVLGILGGIISSRSISESRVVQRQVESVQAFWLAEAGVNRALKELRDDFGTSSVAAYLGAGRYSTTITSYTLYVNDDSRTITAYGYVPASNTHVIRGVEVNATKFTPTNYYGNALYAAGDVKIDGNSYIIDGDVLYAADITRTDHITGDANHDPSISPLAALNYNELRTLSQAQGNYHDASSLEGPFPTSFWYNQAAGIPNIVFLEGNLTLHGNEAVGGFFVVGGEVTYDASLSGDISFSGFLYTRGDLTMNGGGHALNIDGGAWVGEETTMNGGVTISYNPEYANAIANLNLSYYVQITSWKDKQNPYILNH